MVKAVRDLSELDFDQLMSRGIAAARVGETGEARDCLREATRRDAESADAWLWLAGVEHSPQQKRDCFQRVLELRPDDAEARAGLERLAEKYGQGVLAREDEAEVLTCTWHPGRETLLRCNRCNRPMCADCAVKHPVGLRCKECVREMRSPLYTVSPVGYLTAGAVGLISGTLSALLMSVIGGFWFVALLAGAGIGTAVAEAVSIAAGRKRGRGLQLIAVASMILGVAVAGTVLSLLRGASPLGFPTLFMNIGVLIYLVVGLGAAASRLR